MSEVTRALEPDDGEPSPEREAELRAAYEANAKAGKPPYDGVAIRTRGELSWVMRERRWSGEFLLADGYERADFSGANLSLATLWDANLVQANSSGSQPGESRPATGKPSGSAPYEPPMVHQPTRSKS